MRRKKWVRICYRIVTTLRPIGIFHFSFLVILFILAGLWMDGFLKLPKLFSNLTGSILALPILGIGVFLMFWSGLHFVRAGGKLVPFRPPTQLVTGGPYAYVRNPMISGAFIVMFGLGILWRSISVFFLFTPLFILLNVLELKVIEEGELEGNYSQEYEEYKKNVPMFIPRPKNKSNH